MSNMTLSSESYARARSFLMTDARPLERVRFQYEFEGGPAEAVVTELAKFQNPDGGFGHALEPDLRCPESSALATTAGLRALHGLPEELVSPLLSKAIAWLEANWSEEHCCWPIIGESANSAPRAPWWNYDESVAAKSTFNPAGDIVAMLSCLKSDNFLTVKSLSRQLDAMNGKSDIEDHDLICLVHLAEGNLIPDVALIDTISQAIRTKISKTPDDLLNYGLRPQFVINGPTSRFFEANRTETEMELAFLVGHQSADGSWKPNWSWFGQFTETWPIAEKDWSGVLTLDTLKWLRAFGLINQ